MPCVHVAYTIHDWTRKSPEQPVMALKVLPLPHAVLLPSREAMDIILKSPTLISTV